LQPRFPQLWINSCVDLDATALTDLVSEIPVLNDRLATKTQSGTSLRQIIFENQTDLSHSNLTQPYLYAQFLYANKKLLIHTLPWLAETLANKIIGLQKRGRSPG
jgi:hypothetical protein